MLVNGKHYKTIWMNNSKNAFGRGISISPDADTAAEVHENSSVFMIDQNRLPFSFEITECKTHADTARAIKDMTVRGAGAIGAAAGFAMAQAFQESRDKEYIDNARKTIEGTRPTAQNLFYAVERVCNSSDPAEEAQSIAKEDEEACKKIGEFGNALIKNGMHILTHCNAGWLAFVDYGSALSPVYAAHRSGKSIFVFADETRPRGQGARLTAWELRNENVPHAIIPDNAAAYYMGKGEIDMVIVGADRISVDGCVANKIGTLEKAICAKYFGIPFYVAAPLATIDMKIIGSDIPIEERSENEVLFQSGTDENGIVRNIRVASPGSRAKNPAFDVTPPEFIAGIITEKGVVKPSELRRLF